MRTANPDLVQAPRSSPLGLARLVTSRFFLNSGRLRSETAGPNGLSFVEVTQITPCVTVDLVKFRVSLYRYSRPVSIPLP